VSAAAERTNPLPSRLYALITRSLLPAEINDAYGMQMQETFARLRHDARARAGLRGEVAVWWRELRQLWAVSRSEKGAAKPRHLGAPVSTRIPGGDPRPLRLDGFVAAIRHAVRGLQREPALAVTVIITLALGIGANATMFGVIDRLLLQAPAHIVDPDEVVRIYVQRRLIDRRITTAGITYPDFADFDRAEHFAATAAAGGRELTVGHGEDALRVPAAMVSPSMFSLLGVQPEIGRFLSAEDDVDGRATVAVLGHDFWQRLGGDPGIIGTELRLGGTPHTVVGVAPAGFTGVGLRRIDVWVPLRSPVHAPASSWEQSRGWYWLRAVARLAEGATVEAAEAEATALHRAGRADDNYYDDEASVMLGALVEARGTQRSDESVVARWLSGVSAVVLLVACANVANMLLARGVRRRREIGVRLALGVSRGRLIAGQLTESILLAGAGGLAALAVAYGGGRLVRSVLLPDIYWPSTPLDERVLLFTFAAALGAGALAGIVPAWQATRQDVVRVLRGGARDGGRGSSHLRRLLVVGQAATCVVLLVGAGLFVKSIARVRATDMGFEPDRLIVATPEFDDEAMPDEQASAYFDQVLARLSALPAVDGVAAAAALPFNWALTTSFEVPGVEEEPLFSDGGPYVYAATHDFLPTAGIAVLRGRGFTASDDDAAPRVTIVNEDMAAAYWPGEDPLGRCVHINQDEGCTRVIGVAERVKRGSFDDTPSAQYYVPIAQWSEAFSSSRLVLVRAAPEQLAALLPAVRREMQGASPAVRFVSVQPFRELLDPQARSWALGAALFTAFGALALAIASVGLYGVLAFSVAQRRHEIGVRAALGASAGGLVAMVAGQAARMVAAGLLLGVAAALAAGPYLEPMLFQVSGRDGGVLAGVAVVLALVGAVAAVVPARRAARVQPLIALRQS
jgi:predicted permease